MTLTKSDLAETLTIKLGLHKTDAKHFVDQFFEEIRQALESGEEVKLSGFGNFDLKTKTPRPGRNPRTGEPALITARTVTTFSAGQKLRERIESSEKLADAL